MAKSDSVEVSRGRCESCDSSSGNITYSDGHSYCFSCETYTPSAGPPQPALSVETHKITDSSITADLPDNDSFSALPMKDRNISMDTVKKYGVIVREDGTSFKHSYPYYDSEGRYIAAKQRGFTKKFRWVGDTKAYSESGALFGQQLFEPGSSKSITITEGELDAMAAYQMHGSRYPVVSVTSAGSAPKDVIRNYKYLNSFETIVVCFDADEGRMNAAGEVRYPGQEAALKVAQIFEPGKVRIVTLKEHKDASDYLVEGQAKEFIKEWWDGPRYTPAGLVKAKDLWDSIKDPKVNDSIDYPFKSWNEKTYGMRKSEMVTLTADTGVGKTTIFKEIEHHILRTTPDEVGIGLLHLEEPNEDTALGLLSITANKPLHLPDVREKVSTEELKGYFDETLDNDRIVMWDHFGSNTIDEVIANVRFMAAMGCEYIFLDHLSILVSDQSGDERKQLDEAATKLKTLCMEKNLGLFQVIHQNRAGEIRGTAGVEQLSNIVIKVSRDKKAKDDFIRNVTTTSVEKNRFCGRTGPSGYLFYEANTGRLRELTRDEVEAYERGTGPEDFNDNTFEEDWKDG